MGILDRMRMWLALKRLQSVRADVFERGVRSILKRAPHSAVAREKLVELACHASHLPPDARAVLDRNPLGEEIRACLTRLPESDVVPLLAARLVFVHCGDLHLNYRADSLLSDIGGPAVNRVLLAGAKRFLTEDPSSRSNPELSPIRNLAWGLARSDDPTASEALLELFKTSAWPCVIEALKIPEGPSPVPHTKKLIARQLLDELLQQAGEGQAGSTLDSSWKSPLAAARRGGALAGIVAGLDTPELIPHVLRWMQQPGRTAHELKGYLELLVRMRAPEAVSSLITWVEEGNGCKWAVETLGELRDPRAVGVIARIALGPSGEVRAEALKALADIGGSQVAIHREVLACALETDQHGYDGPEKVWTAVVHFFCREGDERGLRVMLGKCRKPTEATRAFPILRDAFLKYPGSASPELLTELSALQPVIGHQGITEWDDEHGMSITKKYEETYSVESIKHLATRELARRGNTRPIVSISAEPGSVL